MKKTLLILLVLAVVAVTAPAVANATLIPYPRHVVGSTLTGAGAKNVQFMVLMNDSVDLATLTRRGMTVAVVRQMMIAKFPKLHLHSRAGHTPKRGYQLQCLARRRVAGTMIWLAAWTAPASRFTTIDAFTAMINRTWVWGCVPGGE